MSETERSTSSPRARRRTSVGLGIAGVVTVGVSLTLAVSCRREVDLGVAPADAASGAVADVPDGGDAIDGSDGD
jgi:hypothetical protein